MLPQSTCQAKTVTVDSKRVTRSEALALRRLTRSGKDFSSTERKLVTTHYTHSHGASKSYCKVGGSNAKNCTNGTPSLSLLISNSCSREKSSITLKAHDAGYSKALIDDDSEATNVITSEVLRNDFRVGMIVSELGRSDKCMGSNNSTTIDVSAVQTFFPCLAGPRMRNLIPRHLVLCQPKSDCSDGELFRQRMGYSLSVALGLASPASGSASNEVQELIHNARRGVCTKVYIACLVKELTSLMSILTSDLVGEASYTCMQESLLSSLMNEELGEFCEKISQANNCLLRLRDTVDSIVCEHLEDLYECHRQTR